MNLRIARKTELRWIEWIESNRTRPGVRGKTRARMVRRLAKWGRTMSERAHHKWER